MNWAAGLIFAMGGYAFYVWGSYAVTAGLIAVEIILLRNRQHVALEQLGRGNTGDRL